MGNLPGSGGAGNVADAEAVAIAKSQATPGPTIIAQPSSSSFIVRNAELRQAAKLAVVEALEQVRQLEMKDLEGFLAEEYLIPELQQVLRVLDLETDAVAEILQARKQIELAQGRLQRLFNRIPGLHSKESSKARHFDWLRCWRSSLCNRPH